MHFFVSSPAVGLFVGLFLAVAMTFKGDSRSLNTDIVWQFICDFSPVFS